MSLLPEAVKAVVQKSPRHRARELALQGVYQWRVSGSDASEIEAHLQGEKNLGRYDKPMYARLLRGVLTHQEELQVLLTPYLDRALDELSTVEF